ncbi:lysylphosphatidylglycerol synthase transmembrane domain-containing protein [Fortiea contorta]|uniref:lysylphosphatidylglycerol synthase transmembrane domain-containing protein n=1 Tax=Fortiea contorta TaxID=1892405 RepID=UPI00034C4E06|nr:lysylphosphatidylglycerol synthase domain-containing protein [Fortiea contorta]
MLKQILRWLILVGTLFFLSKAVYDHWLEVTAIQIDEIGWAILVIATGMTLLAHIWAGWIWTLILKELKQPIESFHFIQVYLKTNIAKYLPGNVWHYYGRIVAAKNANIPTSAATLSVLLEPLLMATAGLMMIILFGSQLAVNQTNFLLQICQFMILILVLCAINPGFLNLAIRFLHKWKTKKSPQNNESSINLYIERYPLRPLLGELAFLWLRSTGFILTFFALGPLHIHQIPLLLGAFSCAWLLGLVVPGAPGGLGVFEATAIALLQHRFPAAIVISAIALYRLISIIAETVAAALAWLDERLST